MTFAAHGTEDADRSFSIDLNSLPMNETTRLEPGLNIRRTDSSLVELSRDAWRSTPVFHRQEGTRLSWDSVYRRLTRRAPTAAEVDRRYMAQYIAFQCPHTVRTISKSVKLLRPGETKLIHVSDGVYDAEYPTRQQTIQQSEFTPEVLRSELIEQISALSPTETVFHISSGLDSSILAILAAKVFNPSPVRLATCVTQGCGAADELANVRRLAHDLAADLQVFDFREVDIFAAGRTLIRDCLGYPTLHPSHLVEYLLDRSIACSATKIVNGKGPDDALAGYAWHNVEFSARAKYQSRVMVTPRSLTTELVKAPPDSTEEHWPPSSGDLTLRERILHDSRSVTESSNIIHESISKHLDIGIISPFMHPRIRRGMFELNDEHRISSGRQKVFLRTTFAADYPDYIANFPKMGLRLDLQPYFSQYAHGDLFERIVIDPGIAREYFSCERIRTMIHETLSGSRNYGWQLWSIFCLMNSIVR